MPRPLSLSIITRLLLVMPTCFMVAYASNGVVDGEQNPTSLGRQYVDANKAHLGLEKVDWRGGGTNEFSFADVVINKQDAFLKCVDDDAEDDAFVALQNAQSTNSGQTLGRDKVVRAIKRFSVAGEFYCYIYSVAYGVTLSEYIKNMNYLHTIITLAKVVPQVLEGLSYLHSIGILHGDLKNKNIMVYEDRASNPTRDIVQAKLKVTLIDFDLSELFTREQNIPIAPRYKALTNSRNAICRVDNEEILDVFKAMVYYKEYVEKGYKKEEQIHAFVNGMTPKIKAHTPSANQNEVAAALNSLTYLLKAAHTLTYDLYQCDAAIRASKGLMPTKLIPQHIVDYYNKNRSIL